MFTTYDIEIIKRRTNEKRRRKMKKLVKKLMLLALIVLGCQVVMTLQVAAQATTQQQGSDTLLYNEVKVTSGSVIVVNPSVTTGPTLSVVAKDKVFLNDRVEVIIALEQVNNISAEDFYLTYDKEKLQLYGYHFFGENYSCHEDVKDGYARFILANRGKENAISGKGNLVKFVFGAVGEGEAYIDIIKGRIASIDEEIVIEDSNCLDHKILIQKPRDIDMSGSFTLKDLAIDAWYYNQPIDTIDSTKYNVDLVKDGKIDEKDLWEIVKEILDNDEYQGNK